MAQFKITTNEERRELIGNIRKDNDESTSRIAKNYDKYGRIVMRHIGHIIALIIQAEGAASIDSGVLTNELIEKYGHNYRSRERAIEALNAADGLAVAYIYKYTTHIKI